jgi:hypothetical protein
LPTLRHRGPEAARQTNGWRRHVLLPARAGRRQRLSSTISTDVTVLDKDEGPGVYCQVTTDRTPTSSTTNAVLQSDLCTPPVATHRRTITIVEGSLDLARDLCGRAVRAFRFRIPSHLAVVTCGRRILASTLPGRVVRHGHSARDRSVLAGTRLSVSPIVHGTVMQHLGIGYDASTLNLTVAKEEDHGKGSNCSPRRPTWYPCRVG